MVNHKTVLTTTLIRLGVYLFIWLSAFFIIFSLLVVLDRCAILDF